MEQIYYTQCPIGYGLGASSGFQIKRRSPGYVVPADFRHFSLRAFVAGTRQPAPTALRYRRGEGDRAEIAWLTPRSHEYETERGLWGRPGGHFAHGLQLSDAELRALDDFPAGLYDGPFWTRSDRVPTRGQPLAELEPSMAEHVRPPTFAAVAPLAEWLDGEHLARLLTAVAAAARSGRTLFLIDEPARLDPWIALLTFAFPQPWRADLTFSTYHDRPEELPGFRIQGTIPAARPNRPALLAQGYVAEAAAGSLTIEPGIEPAGWARTLAGWLIHHHEADEVDWQATRRRALSAQEGSDGRWAEEWLDRLFGLHRWIGAPAPVPAGAPEWAELGRWTAWTARSGLAAEWVGARPPAWWLAASSTNSAPGPESRAALLAHVRLPESWQGDTRGALWGEVVARWAAGGDESVRRKMAAAVLSAAPAALRPAVAGGLIRNLPPEAAAATLSWLSAQPAWDPNILLPLRVHSAAATALESDDSAGLQELIIQGLALPGATAGVLDALEAEACDRPGSREKLAEQVALALARGAAEDALGGVLAVHRWAMEQGEEPVQKAWLAPFWERQFADRLNADHWRAIFQKLPSELARRVLPVVLHIAAGARAVDEAVRWGIEELVLPLPESDRPHDPTWPGLYLDRLPSGIDLLHRLVKERYRGLGVPRWLEAARDAGELSAAQAARLDDCQRYRRVLSSRNARALLEIKLPDVPAAERGVLLNQILRHLADGSDEALNLALDSCRAAWPEGFQPRAPGLALLAKALAQPLLAERAYPELWLGRVTRVLDRLSLSAAPGQGFEPDGLVSFLVAATTRHSGETFDPWRFRAFLLEHDLAWKSLAADVGRDLEGVRAGESVKILDEWDQRLAKGPHTRRFYELWFNVCNPAQLVHAVVSRAVDTRDFALRWWNADVPGQDIRERLVRQAPMVPLRDGSVTTVRHWLQRPLRRGTRPSTDDLVPIDEERRTEGAAEWLITEEGRVRWQFLNELSLFAMSGTPAARNDNVKRWYKHMPLAQVADFDRYQLLASIIKLIDDDDPDLIAPLASWLFKGGVSDVERIKTWTQELDQDDPVPGELTLARVGLVGRLCDELKTKRREERERR
jgi:hypothetical protein